MRLKDTGLTSQDIKDKVNKYMIETYERFDFLAERAKDMYMYDENGEEYLDFYAGIAVNNAGSCNEKVVAAVKDQVGDIMHTFNYPYTIPQALLAEKVCETIDFSKYENVLFISKSVGTVISSAYAQKHNIRCKQILYTPLEQTYKFEHPDAIAFLGTSDLWSNTANVKMLSNEQNVPIYMYKKADHSLETGDIIKDIEILEDVMKRTKKYL